MHTRDCVRITTAKTPIQPTGRKYAAAIARAVCLDVCASWRVWEGVGAHTRAGVRGVWRAGQPAPPVPACERATGPGEPAPPRTPSPAHTNTHTHTRGGTGTAGGPNHPDRQPNRNTHKCTRERGAAATGRQPHAHANNNKQRARAHGRPLLQAGRTHTQRRMHTSPGPHLLLHRLQGRDVSRFHCFAAVVGLQRPHARLRKGGERRRQRFKHALATMEGRGRPPATPPVAVGHGRHGTRLGCEPRRCPGPWRARKDPRCDRDWRQKRASAGSPSLTRARLL